MLIITTLFSITVDALANVARREKEIKMKGIRKEEINSR